MYIPRARKFSSRESEKKLTIGVDDRHVRPVEVAHEIDEQLRLIVIRRHHPEEGRVSALVAQVPRGARIADLKSTDNILILKREGGVPREYYTFARPLCGGG